MTSPCKYYRPIVVLLLLLSLCTGCASTGSHPDAENDPVEPFNRKMYVVNDVIDVYFFKPVAQVYKDYVPLIFRDRVTNFFNNLTYLNTIVNTFLQGKVKDGFSDSGRFIVNSTLGVGGLFDPATQFGLVQHREDLGQTLGVWGVKEGAYLYLPFIGPNSVRDAPDLVTSSAMNPFFYFLGGPITIPIGALAAVNTRANLLDATRIRDEAALDPYTFTREAYRQRRKSDIYDGNVPTEELEEIDIEDDNEGKDSEEPDDKKPGASSS